MRFSIILLFILYFNAFVFAQKDGLISGPWAGNVQMRTAQIWLEVTAATKKVQVKCTAIKAPVVKIRGEWEATKANQLVTYKGALGNDFNPIKININGLEINTTYRYEVFIDDKKVQTNFETKFTTQDLWQYRKPAPDFTFLAGSCAYINQPEYDRPGKPYGGDSSIFETMAKTQAAYHVWMGDNWYTREVDFGSAWGMNYRASRDRSQQVYQKFMASMPQYAIWDDHDYGPNDAGKSFILKDESREVFKNYTLNPSYGEDQKGIYTIVNYSDVDMFLTDDRFFRTEDEMPDSVNGKPSTDKHFFGLTQMEWLKNSLIYSTATFKIIVIGSQVLNPLNKYECMQHYSYEYQQLIQFITEQKIPGVIFFSGDRHHSEVVQLQQKGFYTLYDATISSYTAGISKPTGIEKNNPFRVAGTLVEENNFGKVSVTGPKENRVLKIDFFGTKGNNIATWSVSSKELQVPL